MTVIPHVELKIRLRELEAKSGTFRLGVGPPILVGGCAAGALFCGWLDQSSNIRWIPLISIFLTFVCFIQILLRWHALRVEIKLLRGLLMDSKAKEITSLAKVGNAV